MARSYPQRIWMGIDPGNEGGIGIIPKDGEPSAFLMPPTTKDLYLTLKPYRHCDVIVVLEKVHSMPWDGHMNSFTFGKGVGKIIGVLVSLDFTIVEVPPKVWKGALMPRVKDKSDKAESIKRSKELFPQVCLIPPRCRTEYDGIAEGMLMAEYSRRYFP